MSFVDPEVEEYAEAHTEPADDVLVRALRATRVLEVGTFTGYSSISMARALPPDGKVTSVDVNADTTEIARRYAAEAGVADLIDYRVGPGREVLAELEGPFDLVFIDADKDGYVDYYEAALPLLSDGGLLIADNVLWSGRVVSDPEDDSTRAIQRFNEHVRGDDRVERVMLTVRDGMTLVRRR